MSWNSRERRQFVRISLPLEIYLSGSPSSLPAKTENISAGGLRLLTNHEFTPGTTVNLDIYGVQKKPIICQGNILWVLRRKKKASHNPFCYDTGIEFSNIKKEDLKAIQDIITESLSHR